MNKIPVMELFGPTIQGEGMVIGQKTMFVRTAGCDYQCAWCDSAFTWNGTERDRVRMLSPHEILLELKRLGGTRFNHITITGGNPALIGEPMAALIDLGHQQGYRLALETQGSKMQDWFLSVDDLTLSPKPPSAHMDTDWVALDSIVERLTQGHVNFSMKIVVFDDADIAYAKSVFSRYPAVAQKFLQPGNARVDDPGEIAQYLLHRLEWLFQVSIHDAELNEIRVLPQLHAMVWDNQRCK